MLHPLVVCLTRELKSSILYVKKHGNAYTYHFAQAIVSLAFLLLEFGILNTKVCIGKRSIFVRMRTGAAFRNGSTLDR
jgi:hypothetical protein